MITSELRVAIPADASDWVEEELGTANLRDRRLTQRLLLVAQRMFDSPDKSLKATSRGWAEVMGAHRFFENEKVTEEAVLAPHREATLHRVQEQGRVLVLQDTTEVDYSSQKELEGKGSLSVEQRQGFFAHSQFVVTPERVPLGVWGTKIYARDAAEEKVDRKQLPIEMKESYRWLEGYRDACRLQEMAPRTQVVSVSDREGDIYEIFLEWHRRRECGDAAAEWIIRSNQDRCLGSRRKPSRRSDGIETARGVGTEPGFGNH